MAPAGTTMFDQNVPLRYVSSWTAASSTPVVRATMELPTQLNSMRFA